MNRLDITGALNDIIQANDFDTIEAAKNNARQVLSRIIQGAAGADIYRESYTVYVRDEIGMPHVLFHVAEPNEYHLSNTDKLITIALIAISEAKPVRLFFSL